MKRLHRGNKDHIDDSANIEKMQMKMLKEQDRKLVSLDSQTSQRMDALNQGLAVEDLPVFSYQRETQNSIQKHRILPDYFSPRKNRLKEKKQAAELERNYEFLLKMARETRQQAKLEARTQKAVERSRNKTEVERLTKSTSSYMKGMLVEPYEQYKGGSAKAGQI